MTELAARQLEQPNVFLHGLESALDPARRLRLLARVTSTRASVRGGTHAALGSRGVPLDAGRSQRTNSGTEFV